MAYTDYASQETNEPLGAKDIQNAFQNMSRQADWQRQQTLAEQEAAQRGVGVNPSPLTGGAGTNAMGVGGTTPGGSYDDQYLGGVAAAMARQPNSGIGNNIQSQGGAFAMPSDFTPGVTGNTQFQPQRWNTTQSGNGAGSAYGNAPQNPQATGFSPNGTGGSGNPAQFRLDTANFGNRPPINQMPGQGPQQPQGQAQQGGGSAPTQGGTPAGPQAVPGSTANGNMQILHNAALKAQANQTQQQTGMAPGAGGAPMAGQGQPNPADPYGLQTGQNTLAQYIQQKQDQVTGAQGAYQTAQAGLNTPVPLPNSQSLADQGIPQTIRTPSGVLNMALSPAGQSAAQGAREAANTQALLTSSRQVTSAQDATTLLAAVDQQMTTLESQRAALQQSAGEGNRSAAIQIMGINLQLKQLQQVHDQFIAMYGQRAQAQATTQAQDFDTQTTDLRKQALANSKFTTALNLAGSNPEAVKPALLNYIQSVDVNPQMRQYIIKMAASPSIKTYDDARTWLDTRWNGKIPDDIRAGMLQLSNADMNSYGTLYRGQYNSARAAAPLGQASQFDRLSPENVGFGSNTGGSGSNGGGTDAVSRWQTVLSSPNSSPELKQQAQQKIAALTSGSPGNRILQGSTQ